MAAVTEISIIDGIPTAGTGEVKTIDALITALIAIEGAISGAAVITDANGTLQQYLRGLVVLKLLTNASLTTIKNPGLSASATFTPAAASHVAGDCNGAAGTFALGAISASRVMITGASLEIDGATAEATAWRLYLFNVTPPSAVADDGAFTLASGDRASFLGQVELGTAIDLVDTQYVEQNGINKPIKLAGTSVFGYLVNLTTLTPANVAHIVTLHAVQI